MIYEYNTPDESWEWCVLDDLGPDEVLFLPGPKVDIKVPPLSGATPSRTHKSKDKSKKGYVTILVVPPTVLPEPLASSNLCAPQIEFVLSSVQCLINYGLCRGKAKGGGAKAGVAHACLLDADKLNTDVSRAAALFIHNPSFNSIKRNRTLSKYTSVLAHYGGNLSVVRANLRLPN